MLYEKKSQYIIYIVKVLIMKIENGFHTADFTIVRRIRDSYKIFFKVWYVIMYEEKICAFFQ